MDPAFHEVLRQGAQALLLQLDERAVALLERYADRLLLWNRKVNLTSVTEAGAFAEKHLVDSLALLRMLGAPTGRTVLDIGSGGGLPGIALACARPDLQVTCCDSVAKKVAFLKLVSAELGLNVKAETVRASGDPDREGLPRAAVVVSRALTDVLQWVPLGSCYVAPGGKLFAMLGRSLNEPQLREIGEMHGLALEQIDRFKLPMSGAERAIVRWGRASDVPRGTEANLTPSPSP